MALTQQFTAGQILTASQLNQSSVPVVSSTSDITSPFTGQLVLLTTGNLMWRYTGSAWVPYSGLIGEVVRTSASSAFTTTEVVLDTVTVNLVSGVTYRITCDTQFGTSSATTTTTAFERVRAQIREDNVSGTVIALRDVTTVLGGGVSYPMFLQARFVAASTASKTFVGTGDRITGAGNITSFADASSSAFFRIETL